MRLYLALQSALTVAAVACHFGGFPTVGGALGATIAGVTLGYCLGAE